MFLEISHPPPLYRADRYFLERCLTFGSSSSPGLFDRFAELILLLSLWTLGMDRALACRQLDDAVMIASGDQVRAWYEAYTSLCAHLGVRLAPEEDDKAFSCASEGTILGVYFNLDLWTWSISQERGDKIRRRLQEVLTQDSVSMKSLGSLLGKLGAYMDVFEGRWERAFLLAAWHPDQNPNTRVPVTPAMRSQAGWWDRRIVMAMKKPARIPDARPMTPVAGVHIFTDSAGGLGSPGSGFGAAVWTWPRSYVAHYWPASIRLNIPVDGTKLANKLM